MTFLRTRFSNHSLSLSLSPTIYLSFDFSSFSRFSRQPGETKEEGWQKGKVPVKLFPKLPAIILMASLG